MVNVCPARRSLALVLSSLITLHTGLPMAAFAERFSPEIELTSPSERIETEEVFTPMAEIGQDTVPEAAPTMLLVAPAGQTDDVGFNRNHSATAAISTIQAPVHATAQSDGPTIKGSVNVEKEFVPDVVFDDVHTVAKGERLTLVMMDLLASGYSMEGDEFNARVKVPVERDGKVLIPKGALVKGHLAGSNDPGEAFSKRAKIVLVFDYILMPDGRKVPFKSEFMKGDSGLKAVGRAVGGSIGSTISGAIRGVLVGLRFGGMKGAAMTNGATLIGGGGLGAIAGLGRGLSQRGSHVLLNEGDEIQVALQEPLQLPTMNIQPDTQNEILAQGLNVKVADYTLGRDPFRVEKLITLKLVIDNQTDYRFGSFDMALVDEYNDVFSVSPFGENTDFVMQVEPKRQTTTQLAFSVKNPDSRHYLVFYKPYTRDVVAKISLAEALKALTNTGAKGKSRRSS